MTLVSSSLQVVSRDPSCFVFYFLEGKCEDGCPIKNIGHDASSVIPAGCKQESIFFFRHPRQSSAGMHLFFSVILREAKDLARRSD